jgi:hypothetical protein
MEMGSRSGLRLMGRDLSFLRLGYFRIVLFKHSPKITGQHTKCLHRKCQELTKSHFSNIFRAYSIIFEHSTLLGNELLPKLCSPPFCKMLNNQSRKPKQNETKRNEGNTTNNNMTSILTLG